jgi:hypothetical protein
MTSRALIGGHGIRGAALKALPKHEAYSIVVRPERTPYPRNWPATSNSSGIPPMERLEPIRGY